MMKKLLAVVLSVFFAFACFLRVTAADKPSVSATAFVLYCPDNGKIILSKNENKRMKPASTTKLMTTLLTLEEAAVGMMMSSGNDAANAAAVSISGSIKKFANLMNARASEIGMENTHFVTPSGLDDDKHYSTAYDLALLMAQCLENEAFADLTSQKSVAVSFEEPNNKKITYANHNRLLSMYSDCIGGKTGYTEAAGRCLVSAAKRDGVTLICVTLDDKNDWQDHINLYDHGFSQLSSYESPDSSLCIEVPCVGGESDVAAVMGESDVKLVVDGDKAKDIKRKIYLDNFVYAPVISGEALGRIDYTLDGKVIRSTSLVAVEDIAFHKIEKSLWDKIKDLFTNG